MSSYKKSSAKRKNNKAPAGRPPPPQPNVPGDAAKINWSERKEQCEKHDSSEINDYLSREAMRAILTVTDEVRDTPYGDNELQRMGPSFLLHCAAAIVHGIADTPWEYYVQNKENVHDRLLFIQNELYETGYNYTEGQTRLKKIMLMKFKTLFSDIIKLYLEFDVTIVFSNNLFNSLKK